MPRYLSWAAPGLRPPSTTSEKRSPSTLCFSALGLEGMLITQETKYYEPPVQSEGLILVKYNHHDQSSPDSTNRRRSLYVPSTHVKTCILHGNHRYLSPLQQHTSFPLKKILYVRQYSRENIYPSWESQSQFEARNRRIRMRASCLLFLFV